MSRKFVYYLEGLSRSIVITDKDNDMSIEEISRYASEMMSGDKILRLDTKPSDGIALALRTDSPIYIKKSLLEQVGRDIC